MRPGTKVKMSEELKEMLNGNLSSEHVDEFGDCVGIVQGLTDFNGQLGPEVDVKWQPSNLRYAYHPKHLIIL